MTPGYAKQRDGKQVVKDEPLRLQGTLKYIDIAIHDFDLQNNQLSVFLEGAVRLFEGVCFEEIR